MTQFETKLEAINISVCGRIIGSGSDIYYAPLDNDSNCFISSTILYNFKPIDSIPEEINGAVEINFENGIITTLNDDDTPNKKWDLIDILKDVPRKNPLLVKGTD